MKKTLLIAGIILIILGVFGLVLGCLFWYAKMHTLDGSESLYRKQGRIVMGCFICGAAVLVLGVICLVLRRKVA